MHLSKNLQPSLHTTHRISTKNGSLEWMIPLLLSKCSTFISHYFIAQVQRALRNDCSILLEGIEYQDDAQQYFNGAFYRTIHDPCVLPSVYSQSRPFPVMLWWMPVIPFMAYALEYVHKHCSLWDHSVMKCLVKQLTTFFVYFKLLQICITNNALL